MKIVDVTAFAVRFSESDFFGADETTVTQQDTTYLVLPGWRGLYPRMIETMIVRIETDTGVVGWGEGQTPVGPEVTAAIVERLIRPTLLGADALATQHHQRQMYGLMNLRGHYGGFMVDAIAGVDSALWDIKGKALGVPVHVLLGGPCRKRIPVYVSGIRGSGAEERVETMKGFLGAGFTRFKLFGGSGVREDADIVRRLRHAGGDLVWLAADNLWKYDMNDAMRLGRELERLGCAWYEAPVDPEDVDGNAELARSLDMPIANGETQRTRFEFLPWFQKRALDIAQPDIGRTGISEGVRIVELAETFHVPVALHVGMAAAPLIAASLHVAASMENVSIMEYQPVMLSLANRFLRRPLRCEDGAFIVPDEPGLGIAFDEDALMRFARRPA